MDAKLAALGRGQDGVFDLAQAIRYGGLTERQVRRRVGCGDLVEMHPDVFRSATTPVTFRTRSQAALLAVGGSVALCGGSAAHLVGLFGFGQPSVVEVAVHIAREDIGLDGVDIRRRRGFCAEQVVMREGLAMLEPHLQVLDLARTMSRTALHNLVQQEVYRRRVDVRSLNAVRGRGREGSALLGRVLADYAGAHDTVAEVVGCGLLRDAGVHDLEPNASPHPMLSPADALVRAARMGIDFQGSIHRQDRKRRTDAAKVVDYAGHDYLLVPATNDDVFLGGIRWARRIVDLVDRRRVQPSATG